MANYTLNYTGAGVDSLLRQVENMPDSYLSSGGGALSGSLDIADTLTVGGREYGVNKVLWSGLTYMEDWATITLSEAISAQPNGIVLVWSYYNNGAAVDDIWTTHPIPKEFVARHEGNGYSAGAITAAGPYLKHVYIADTTIRGWANNSVTGTTGNVTVYNNYFVLRYVIGV